MPKQKHIFSAEEWKKIVEELSFSKRQSEIIHLLLQGCGDKQIARELSIAVPTLRTHFNRIFMKYQLQDRNELVLYVFRHYKENSLGKSGNSEK